MPVMEPALLIAAVAFWLSLPFVAFVFGGLRWGGLYVRRRFVRLIAYVATLLLAAVFLAVSNESGLLCVGLPVFFGTPLCFAVVLAAPGGWRRYPVGRCQSCGYDLTGNASGVCSECGTPTDAERPLNAPHLVARRGLWMLGLLALGLLAAAFWSRAMGEAWFAPYGFALAALTAVAAAYAWRCSRRKEEDAR